ncbi:TPA: hypothetical protein KDZ97_005015 [Vibrio parahaemolyticus]|uniref:hypothetical protein n=1 Tax=Vibrio parahaemolyticus TaxID=670 RepID=UPI001B81CA25|nr:hypothetical protein [Vibrio parahaemolyticus]MDF5646672.1 hypothetical protein [Vibrio parahaemolyticus]MDF5666069.1 hypothetical protein [Vibrio parahaemolyticus]WKV19319.1 hypothetical protein [Vibrio parahaemolyticus]HBC3404761.1 hypothetical protein [Vibrio parahaemolyticus]HBC3540437.1 hypothetical protein [Vibrio parahaemolyticus]
MKNNNNTNSAKKLILVSAVACVISAADGSDFTNVFEANVKTLSFLVIVMGLSALALIKPQFVKEWCSKASVTLAVPLVVLSVLKVFIAYAVEPMWSVIAVCIFISLSVQIIADIRIVTPQLREVFVVKKKVN